MNSVDFAARLPADIRGLDCKGKGGRGMINDPVQAIAIPFPKRFVAARFAHDSQACKSTRSYR